MEQKTAYLRLWLGDEGLPLIMKWTDTGRLDFSTGFRPSIEWIHSTNLLGSSRRRIKT